MNDNTSLDDLFSLWKKHYKEGRDLSAEQLAGDREDLVPELRRRIDALGRQLDALRRLMEGADARTLAPLQPHEDLANQSTPPSSRDGATLTPAATATTPPPSPASSPDGYEILGELGRGGMGVVYKARQIKAQRLVALKMLLAGAHAGADDLARFSTEIETIARLQHPGIVQVFEVAEHEGRPYFSLELCEGGSLEKKLSGTPLPPEEAIALVEPLARAMQAAHDKGVVHRDLKPANVLLTGEGLPKVTDFGLAKKLGVAGNTATGAVVGTPSYMAPEQAEGKKDIGPQADVYALGAILYECLTGRPPFKAATILDTLMQVIAEEPVAPHQLNAKLRRDLETITLKCLQKEPTRRYVTASALAEDLRRFQAGESISARPVSPTERARRWCRRNKAIAGAMTAAMLVLVLGSAVATVFGWRAANEAEKARLSEERAREEAEKARLSEAWAKREAEKSRQSEAITRSEKARAEEQRDRADGLVYVGQIDRALGYWREGNMQAAADLRSACRWDLRGWEHKYLHTLLDHSHHIFKGHTSAVTSVVFSPDGTRLASASTDQTVRVWDARTGRQTLELRGQSGTVTSVVFSPDGAMLASAYRDQTVRVWDIRTGHQTLELKGHTGGATSVDFSPDGTRLASAAEDRTVRVWDARTGQQILQLQGHTDVVNSVVFSPDGTKLASAARDQTVRVWTARTGQQMLQLQGHATGVNSVAFNPDGTRLASAAGDPIYAGKAGELRVWDLRTGQKILELQRQPVSVLSVVFSPEGTQIASASEDRAVRVWDVRTGQQTLEFKGHTSTVTSVVFNPDGTKLASAARDQTVRVWDVRTGHQSLELKRHTGAVISMAFSPEGTRLASASSDKTVRVWDAWTGQQTLELKGHTDSVTSVVFSLDGTRLASASTDRTVRVWDARTGQLLLELLGHTGAVTSVIFSPDDSRLACASSDTAVRVWDARTGQQILQLQGHTEGACSVVFSPDGTRLACAYRDQTVRVWDARTGQQTLQLLGHTGPVTSVVYSPDGTRLASASEDRTLRVWDAGTGQQILQLNGHTDSVTSVVYSPDGTRLVSASSDATVRVWHARTGQQTLELKGETSPVTSVVFSPDGTTLASATRATAVRMWDGRKSQETLELKGHTGAVASVVYSPDGTRVIAADQQGTVRSWNALTGQEIVPNKDPAPMSQGLAISPDGQRVARIVGSNVMIEPKVGVSNDDLILRRMFDPLMDVPYRREQVHLALAREDALALAFHVRPLLVNSIAQSAARSHVLFPLWAQRPPLVRVDACHPDQTIPLTPKQLAALDADLSALAKPDEGWEVRMGRGWVRYLQGDVNGAFEDLRMAMKLRPTEPMSWALFGTVALRQGRMLEAEEARGRLAGWPGLDVSAWHVAEADVCEAEGAIFHTLWHLKHLATRASTSSLFVRIGRLLLTAGREDEAFAAFAQAASHERVSYDALAWHARAAAVARDAEAYRNACDTLARDAPMAWLRVLLLRPGALADYARLLSQFSSQERNLTHAGLLLRSGKPKEAAQMMRRSVISRVDLVTGSLLLALAERQLGNKDTALRALAEAKRRLLHASLPAGLLPLGRDGLWSTLTATAATPSLPWEVQLEIRLLLAEAEAAVAAP